VFRGKRREEGEGKEEEERSIKEERKGPANRTEGEGVKTVKAKDPLATRSDEAAFLPCGEEAVYA